MTVSFQQLRDASPGVFGDGCPTRTVLDHVMSKWGVLVLMALTDGTARWGELKRSVDGVSEKMLATTLRALVDDGLVSRTAYPEVPPRVEYALTERGDELMTHVMPLMAWIGDHADDILGR